MTNKPASEKMRIIHDTKRPMITDYINELFTDFTELHGDRYFSDDHAILGGVGYFNGTPVTVIGHRKGRTIEQNMDANFGMAHPEGYRKALRLAHQAEKFHRPVINFVDTGGAFCGVGAEERGQGEAISKNLTEMMTLNTPVISIFVGEGGSGGALARPRPQRRAVPHCRGQAQARPDPPPRQGLGEVPLTGLRAAGAQGRRETCQLAGVLPPLGNGPRGSPVWQG